MGDALGSFFRWVRREHRELLPANPMVDTDRPGQAASRNRVLNFRTNVRRADEMRWFWQATDEMPEPFGDLFKLLLLTACRREEIARVDDTELTDDADVLRLPGERTKNGIPHDVQLPPAAVEIMRRRRERAVKKAGHNTRYLFSTTGSSPVSGFSKMKKKLDEAMVKLAKEERGADAVIAPWRLHDLRRTCNTGMNAIGVPPHVVEACLNHKKKGVEGVYNQEKYEKDQREALARWATYVRAAVSENVVPLKRTGA